MPRLRVQSLIAVSAAILSLVAQAGCARHAWTRVFLHGEVVDEDGRLVPLAVVRLDSRETVTDEHGHYRYLYLQRCLRGYAGTQGTSSEEIEAFAKGYRPFAIGFELDSVEVVGLASCPKETDKYLRLTLVRENAKDAYTKPSAKH